jgi:hypothetical protein
MNGEKEPTYTDSEGREGYLEPQTEEMEKREKEIQDETNREFLEYIKRKEAELVSKEDTDKKDTPNTD